MRTTDGDRDEGGGYLARAEETETHGDNRTQDQGGNWDSAGWGGASGTEDPGKEEPSGATGMEGRGADREVEHHCGGRAMTKAEREGGGSARMATKVSF